MKEREIIKQYNRGEMIPATDFLHGGTDFSFDVVEPMWRKDQSTKQFDLWGNVWIQRVKPLEMNKTLEQEHLCRPVVLHNGETRTISREVHALVLAREQLRKDMRT